MRRFESYIANVPPSPITRDLHDRIYTAARRHGTDPNSLPHITAKQMADEALAGMSSAIRALGHSALGFDAARARSSSAPIVEAWNEFINASERLFCLYGDIAASHPEAK